MDKSSTYEESMEELKDIIYRKNMEELQRSLYQKRRSAKLKTPQRPKKAKNAKHLVFELYGKQFTI